MLLRIYFKCCAYQDMVSFRRPSDTEVVMGPSSSYHDQVKERLIAIVKDHEL